VSKTFLSFTSPIPSYFISLFPYILAKILLIFLIFEFFGDFVYLFERESEREREHGRGERERERRTPC